MLSRRGKNRLKISNNEFLCIFLGCVAVPDQWKFGSRPMFEIWEDRKPKKDPEQDEHTCMQKCHLPEEKISRLQSVSEVVVYQVIQAFHSSWPSDSNVVSLPIFFNDEAPTDFILLIIHNGLLSNLIVTCSVNLYLHSCAEKQSLASHSKV